MPSEDKILQNGRIGGEDGDGQKTEEAMLLPEKNKIGPIQGLKRQCKRNTRCVVVAFMMTMKPFACSNSNRSLSYGEDVRTHNMS
ncbi:hypothetical protein Tco_1539665 [Tanacetum coccineum]